MAFHEHILSAVRCRNTFFFAGILGLCGCAAVGPQSIVAGRGVYTEVINRTEDEQILNALVRLRYDETFGMISVATVQIRFRDRWFYIDATDTRSKRAFAFLQTFIGIRLADPGAAQQAPVLTVPVN